MDLTLISAVLQADNFDYISKLMAQKESIAKFPLVSNLFLCFPRQFSFSTTSKFSSWGIKGHLHSYWRILKYKFT